MELIILLSWHIISYVVLKFMIKILCKNKLYFFTSQTFIWFKELYYTILLIIDHKYTRKK
jgi:hypothetical protein